MYRVRKVGRVGLVDWCNNKRLLVPLGNVPSTKAENAHYWHQVAYAEAAWLKPKILLNSRGACLL